MNHGRTLYELQKQMEQLQANFKSHRKDYTRPQDKSLRSYPIETDLKKSHTRPDPGK